MDKKLFEYLKKCINKKEVDNDTSFQLEVMDVDESSCTNMDDNSKEPPNFATGKAAVGITKNATVSKHALVNANYACAGNHEHTTFDTTKGRPYMEGHHLIPCTYTNAKYYWDNQGINIDCQANIVCLCPTCHRQIHYGSDYAKRTLIEKLYEESKDKLKSVGLTLTLEELLKLYSINV